MKTIIVWYRNDLRIHDHPALSQAVQHADRVVPVFILDTALLRGTRAGANRNRFLLECLDDLRKSLRKADGELFIREGEPAAVLRQLADETQAEAVYYTEDYTPYARRRDAAVGETLQKHGLQFEGWGGRLAVDDTTPIVTKGGQPFKVFTPFWKKWSQIDRRQVYHAPRAIHTPDLPVGRVPAIADITHKDDLSPDVIPGGEHAGRSRLEHFLRHDIADYATNQQLPGADKTSRLSAYLHFGCLSPRELETILPDNPGADAWHRQLAWRDFYHYVLLNFPGNTTQEFQEKYRSLAWSYDKKLLDAWQEGCTGYPMVDAAMRQLKQEGWMHNRARLVVGSFLTKDLGIDWRAGEAYFMRMLIDGDTANNNGNWQWVASVGVDPAPMYRRLYNPTSQGTTYDPDGSYIRRYVPELAKVTDTYLMEPWTMPDDEQQRSGCKIGSDYPAPIVDHRTARQAALEKYRSVR